jgi:uncharacterized protein (TIGR00251 family)
MEVRVKVIVNARKESLEEGRDGRLLIALRAPREDGKANARLIEVLAERFAVPVNHVRIVRGHQQSSKTVSILFS